MLLGQQWLRLNWKVIRLAILDTTLTQLDSLLKSYSEVFQNELGIMNLIKASLKLKEDASPKFHRPRLMPFALKGAMKKELNRLEELGEKVTYSKWATPIVPVPKKDGKVRICRDCKVTVNQCFNVDQ